MRTLLAIARADFLERTRRYAFLVTLLATVYATFGFLPPNHSSYATLQFHGTRGIYNSAWVGCLVASLAAVFLSFAGFFLVKGAVTRDRRTGVGQILAATRLGKIAYLAGKVLSNFAVLIAIAAVLVVTAAIVQIVRGEAPHIEPVPLVLPFLTITLPTMLVVAAVAVLFDCLPGLHGGGGNVVYFFLWIFTVSSGAIGLSETKRRPDVLGMRHVWLDMDAASRRAYPDSARVNRGVSMGINVRPSGSHWNLATFEWRGMPWSAGVVAGRAVPVAVAAGLVLLASIPFDRFDAAPAERRRRKGKTRPSGEVEPDDAVSVPSPMPVDVPRSHRARGAPLTVAAQRPSFWPMLRAELAIVLRGRSRWWWFIALSLAVACLFVPLGAVRAALFPIAMIWPIFLWSGMGHREKRFRTDALLFSSPQPVRRQLAAVWAAGFVVALGAGIGFGLRMLIGGDLGGVAGWLAGAAFVPSLALAIGIWTGSSKLFEVLYMLLWYMGPMHSMRQLDFIGAYDVEPRIRLAYLGATLAFIAAAAWRRAWQIRSGV